MQRGKGTAKIEMQQKKAGLIPREDQYVKQAAECRYSSKKVRKIMNKGKIIQVMGPVVDVVFQDGNLPFYQRRFGS